MTSKGTLWIVLSVVTFLATPAAARTSLSELESRIQELENENTDQQGQIDALEEQADANTQAICDLSRIAGVSAPAFCSAVTERLAFTTRDVFTGDLGGVDGADRLCSEAAQEAELPGIYRAWITAGLSTAPAARFVRASVPYVNTNGDQVATDWDNLTDGTLDANLVFDQFGEPVPIGVNRNWTGTAATGGRGLPNCNGWTSSADNVSGTTGIVFLTNEGWTEASPQSCANTRRLYCFQQ